MLNRRADEVESLRKVMADTEKQFVDCLQQIKTLGEEKEQHQKELDDLKTAAQELVEMVDPQEDGVEDGHHYWIDFVERHKRSSTLSPRQPHHTWVMLWAL
jgi:hypothetical protein